MTQYLENVGEVSEIEDVMELDSSGQEHLQYFVMQSKWCCNNVGCQLHHWHREPVLWVGQVLWQDGMVNCVHSLWSRETVSNTQAL